MSLIQQLFEAQNIEGALSEMYASIPGSLETYRTLIHKALEDSGEFGVVDNRWDLGLEGTLGSVPNQIVVCNYGEQKHYRADVSIGSDDKVTFSNVTEVGMEVVFKAKNELAKLEAMSIIETKEFDEKLEATVSVNEKEASVDIAQKADIINGNGRIYSKDVLESAVEAAQKQIEEYGPLLMDSQHRIGSYGQPVSDLREMVAVIHSIEFDNTEGVVSLPKITFVENTAGTDILKLLEAGAKLQVSQRAYGTSVTEKVDGESVEVIKFLRFRGFDLVPGGEASVKGASLNFQEDLEKDEELEEIIEKVEDKPEEQDPPEEDKEEQEEEADLNESKTESESKGEEAEPNPELQEAPKEEESLEEQNTNSPEGGNAMNEQEIKALIEKMQQGGETISAEELSNLQTQLTEQNSIVATLQKDRDLAILESVGKPIVESKVNEIERFNDSQKKLILNSIKLEDLYGSISDVNNVEEVTEKLTPIIESEIDRLDKALATAKLDLSGFPVDANGIANETGGITHSAVQITNEHIPGAEFRVNLMEDVQSHFDEISESDEWRMPDDHPANETLKKIMEGFYKEHHEALINEANEVGQGAIGVRAATISSMVIPIAWRATTALQVCETGRMTRIIEDHPVAFWNPDNLAEGDVATQFMNLNVAEGATIPNAGVKYENYPLLATRQALKTQIRPHAMAAARGTAMSPVMDSISGLAMDIRNRIDRMLWYLHVVAGLQQEAVEVSTFETLTNVSGTQEWKSANRGWIPFEWDKDYDTNNNPTASQFKKLYPADGEDDVSGTALQGLELTTTNATPVDLLYDTDYTVNWTDGSITLTTAGETKRASDNVRAKYSYSKNINFWSVNPPAGTTVYNHLINLRRSVGIAKVRIANRNYKANFLGMNLDIEDLIGNSPHMTTLGGTPADMLSRMNEVSRYAGLAPINTTALDPSYIIVAMRNSVTHKIQTPWTIRGPVINEDTGDDNYIAQQFSGSDVFVKNKIGIVGITGRHLVI